MPSATATQKYVASMMLLVLWMIACPKYKYWNEDDYPMHKGSEAWHPHRLYSKDVEEGLSILATTEPEQVSYLRSRGYPIVFIPGRPGTMGSTTPLGVIEIPYRFENQPAQLAVVLSHELIHELRHDPFTNLPHFPIWRRLLWHQEEEVAHNHDLWVALKLCGHYPSVWNVLGKQWLLEPILYGFVGPICFIDLVCLFLLGWSAYRSLFQTRPRQ